MRNRILTSGSFFNDGIFIVRIFTGVMIIPFGMELFDEKKMNDLTGFLSGTGFPMAVPMAYLAKITEFFGGILLIAGLLTRCITVPLMITMAVVIYTMGGGDIFNSQLPFLFLLLFLGLFFTGPGKWSLDYFLFDRRNFQHSKN